MAAAGEAPEHQNMFTLRRLQNGQDAVVGHLVLFTSLTSVPVQELAPGTSQQGTHSKALNVELFTTISLAFSLPFLPVCQSPLHNVVPLVLISILSTHTAQIPTSQQKCLLQFYFDRRTLNLKWKHEYPRRVLNPCLRP